MVIPSASCFHIHRTVFPINLASELNTSREKKKLAEECVDIKIKILVLVRAY